MGDLCLLIMLKRPPAKTKRKKTTGFDTWLQIFTLMLTMTSPLGILLDKRIHNHFRFLRLWIAHKPYKRTCFVLGFVLIFFAVFVGIGVWLFSLLRESSRK